MAAALFFQGKSGGLALPYLEDFLLLTDDQGRLPGWTWRDLQNTPVDVLDHWSAYREARGHAAEARAAQQERPTP